MVTLEDHHAAGRRMEETLVHFHLSKRTYFDFNRASKSYELYGRRKFRGQIRWYVVATLREGSVVWRLQKSNWICCFGSEKSVDELELRMGDMIDVGDATLS